MNRRNAWVIAMSIGAVAMTAGMTLVILTLAGVTFEGSGEAQSGDGSRLVDSPLITANRDRFAVCVDVVGVDSDLVDTAESHLRSAFAEAERDPAWTEAQLDTNSPAVQAGCPSQPAVMQEGIDIQRGKFGLTDAPEVDEASPFRVFVFVMPSDQLDAIFGDGYPISVEEYLRTSIDTFVPVTMGLYVTPDQLEDQTYLANWLLVLGNARDVSSIRWNN